MNEIGCKNICQKKMSGIKLLPGNTFMEDCIQECTNTKNTESPVSNKVKLQILLDKVKREPSYDIDFPRIMKGGSSYDWGNNIPKLDLSPPSDIKIKKLQDLQIPPTIPKLPIPPTIPKLPDVPEVQPDQMLAVENDTVLYKSCGWLPFGLSAVKATDNEIIEQIYIKPYD